MKQRVRLLSLTVGATISLLTIAGVLIVVGIFNESLNWDIFGPKMEAALYGVFGSSIALACIGVAMTIVLGTQEIVKAFRALQQQRTEAASERTKEAPRKTYVLYMGYAVILLALLVASLAFVNHTVLKHRSNVFKRLAGEQMAHFQPKLVGLLKPLVLLPVAEPPRNHVSRDLYDLMKTFDDLSFVQETTLYLPDHQDTSAMWAYNACKQYNCSKYEKENGFDRFFVAKDFEKAMAAGLVGDNEGLEKLNNKTGFIWYYLVKGEKNKPIAILRIKGNSRANFREYIFLGS
jgi:hypothetical protein